METYRCFVAINLPEEAKHELAGIRAGFKSWPANVKWVEKQNFHLTLKFLGDVTPLQIENLKRALERISSLPKTFEIGLAGLGAFPAPRNPKVIWTGVHDPQKGLHNLWVEVETECAKQGFPRETRPFSPHLTLGRVRDVKPAPGLGELLPNLKPDRLIVPVTTFELMRSKLSGYGPAYSCLASFSLQK